MVNIFEKFSVGYNVKKISYLVEEVSWEGKK